MDSSDPPEPPIQMPIDGVLDLHTFRPRQVKELVLDYLAACQQKGIRQVRIIHGKGIGNLRRTVHAILGRHPEVSSFTLDHQQFGGWGATLVFLKSENRNPKSAETNSKSTLSSKAQNHPASEQEKSSSPFH